MGKKTRRGARQELSSGSNPREKIQTQSSQLSPLSSQKKWQKIINFCFKPLNIKVIFYIALKNWKAKRGLYNLAHFVIQLYVQMVPDLQVLDFTMEEKWYTFSGNCTFNWDLFLGWCYELQCSFQMLGRGRDPQLPVSHALWGQTTDTLQCLYCQWFWILYFFMPLCLHNSHLCLLLMVTRRQCKIITQL